ncbi:MULTISPECIES: tripartite tricarboxylate transporter substrate binding protein [unclassified Limnohabitans]|jgi:tripartite-type tricarboxylate transporter receptor subunit TctC|uniref:Bug family tripartite tricarboxylate transporter substrate binding protein n=1 Tax=unclassified Limnohabitans TaxID=2626134 RepID=UPI0006DBE439|nr:MULTISPECIES: tripartite tricarboxylate transporter substrate binding protein [unclassified Limnohabitans]ALK91760.1 Tripartite tricarboxylate transporter family receptor [Limnohabitans sp. 103DPR2]PUE37610.1 ABC transporter substrate-binding protein [Limnohabitans sp. Hippo4]
MKFSGTAAPSTRRLSLRILYALSLAAPLGLGLLSSTSASAQAYPNRPIRLVVTFPTGGAPDILARLFSEKAQLGQPVVIDNKPGAGGNIGSDIVAKSAGDGYTLVMGTVGTHSINGSLYEKMPYDMVKNFSPISLIASAPNLLVVNNDLPVKTVNELIAYMKANPNKLSFGSPGIGTSVHMSGELFKSMTGTSMTHVPYKGRQFFLPDLLGGSIQLVFDNMPSALPMAKEGKIRAIAQTTAKRSPAAPDVPTVAESLPGFEATTWFAMFAPANTPKPIIDKLNAEVVRVFKLPEVTERLKTLGLDPVLSTPDELGKYQASEIVKWTKVVKESGAKAE